MTEPASSGLQETPSGFFAPASAAYRWTVMVAAGLMLFGSYFAYDSISALSTLIMEGMDVGGTEIGLLDSFYSFPNFIMVLIGGILVDRFGTRIMSIVLSAFIVLGAVVTALAPNLTVMLIGRVLLGMGSESLIVCQSVILAKWFKGRELALSFGFVLTFMRLGSALSLNTLASASDAWGSYRSGLWLAAGVCAVSMLFALAYVVLERNALGRVKLAESDAGDKIVLSDVKKFDRRFWYIALLCVTFYAAIFPFRTLAPDFFLTKWGVTLQQGGRITSIFVVMSMILAPFIGGLVDRIGRRSTLLILGAFLLIPSHAVMGLTELSPIYSMVVLGFSFSLVSAVLWPVVPLIVENKITGTAFGLIFMIQNIGLTLFPIANGALLDRTAGYTASQLMFASLGVFGLIFAYRLFVNDRRKGGVLELGRGSAAEAGAESETASSEISSAEG